MYYTIPSLVSFYVFVYKHAYYRKTIPAKLLAVCQRTVFISKQPSTVAPANPRLKESNAPSIVGH